MSRCRVDIDIPRYYIIDLGPGLLNKSATIPPVGNLYSVLPNRSMFPNSLPRDHLASLFGLILFIYLCLGETTPITHRKNIYLTNYRTACRHENCHLVRMLKPNFEPNHAFCDTSMTFGTHLV